jgi:hypothetical protein
MLSEGSDVIHFKSFFFKLNIHWCFSLTDVRHKSLSLTEGIEEHVQTNEIMNYWIYDTSCVLTSLLISDFKNFKCLVFVVQSVYNLYG